MAESVLGLHLNKRHEEPDKCLVCTSLRRLDHPLNLVRNCKFALKKSGAEIKPNILRKFPEKLKAVEFFF